MFNQVTIIGVGLIGGSLGLEIKRKNLAKIVIGCGRSRGNLRIAQKRKLIDQGVTDPIKAVREADLILLCTPVESIKSLIPLIAKYAKPYTLVMDVGSTKETIIKQANHYKNIYFIGAHPMAGTEKGGANAAEKDLFLKKRCLLTPGKSATREAARQAIRFWKKMGMIVEVISPWQHDQLIAGVSHLPQMAAYALMNTVSHLVPLKVTRRISGGGLKDTTRLASSPQEIWKEICLANSKNIDHSLKIYIKELDKLRQWIRNKNKKALSSYFLSSQKARRHLLK